MALTVKKVWRRATEADAPGLERLVNGAYRGESGRRGWTTEAHLIGGQRSDAELIRETIRLEHNVILIAHPSGEPSDLRGCVHLRDKSKQSAQPLGEARGIRSVCYLGMLTVEVDAQKQGWGAYLLEVSEEFALREFGAETIEMTVLSVRTELIDWYLRHGYRVTGERRPFPYGNERFGRPFVDDLVFEVLVKDLATA